MPQYGRVSGSFSKEHDRTESDRVAAQTIHNSPADTAFKRTEAGKREAEAITKSKMYHQPPQVKLNNPISIPPIKPSITLFLNLFL